MSMFGAAGMAICPISARDGRVCVEKVHISAVVYAVLVMETGLARA
jgi:hypothetical protein